MARRTGTSRPTIYDVARLAGVSLSTVSRVLNGTVPVLPDTERRVRAAIDALGFRPSLLAAGLSSGRTYSLGLVVPDLANPFFAELARAVEDAAAQDGYGVFVCSSDERIEREQEYLRLLEQRGVDGILVCATGPETLASAPLPPVVTLVREVGEAWPLVRTDDVLGGRLAAEHLLQLGHRRIAFLAERPDLPSTRHRLAGWSQALRAEGLSTDLVAHVHPVTCESVQEALHRLLSHGPTGICAGTDLLAVYAIRCLAREGFRVPESISVVGFDNTLVGQLAEVPLTTVAQATLELGRLAVGMLRGMMDGKPEVAGRRLVPPVLVVRGSTSPPRETARR